MTEQDALRELGVRAVRKVSGRTTTVEYIGGGASPASELEQKMWALIQHLLLND